MTTLLDLQEEYTPEVDDKLQGFIERYSARTGTNWTLDQLYLSSGGKLKAVIVAPLGRRLVLRYSQERWKRSD